MVDREFADVNPNVGAFGGTRIPGYSGNRRRASLDHVGSSLSGRIPSNVRIALTNNGEDLREMFVRIDLDGNGTVDEHELTTELNRMALGLSAEECAGIYAAIDDGVGCITLERWIDFLSSEDASAQDDTGAEAFVTESRGAKIPGYGGNRRRASLDRAVGNSAFGKIGSDLYDKLQSAKSSLRQAFESFDTTGSMFLTDTELRMGLEKHGISTTFDEFDSLFEEIDADKDGEISWEEFSDWLTPAEWQSNSMASHALPPARDAARPKKQRAVVQATQKPPPAGKPYTEPEPGYKWLMRGGASSQIAPRKW